MLSFSSFAVNALQLPYSLPPVVGKVVPLLQRVTSTPFSHPCTALPCATPPLSSYWDGAVLPMGLGLSLVINGLFIARHINEVQRTEIGA